MTDNARFTNNIEENQFEYHLPNGTALGKYKTTDNVIILRQVFVPQDLRGKGVASRFMAEIVSYAQSENLKIQPFCSYARTWLEKCPEHHSLTEF